MASTKEIRTRMKSVEQTLKITNAMYLIASSNLRKAKGQLQQAVPYFTKIYTTIADILHRSPQLNHHFLDARPEIPPEKRTVGYIVVSGDKGLAGAYNHNVLKLAEQRVRSAAHPRLFVVGLVGRAYFQERNIPFEDGFLLCGSKPHHEPRPGHQRRDGPALFSGGSWTRSTFSILRWSPPSGWRCGSVLSCPWCGRTSPGIPPKGGRCCPR